MTGLYNTIQPAGSHTYLVRRNDDRNDTIRCHCERSEAISNRITP